MKIRSVHPGFFSDPTLAKLTPHARILYVGLWCYCDDDGRGEWLPKHIDGALFPHEAVHIHGLLGELERVGKLIRYEVAGRQYFVLPAFGRWQHPKYKRTSNVPPPPTGLVPDLEQDSPTLSPSWGQAGTKHGRQEGEGEGVEVEDTHTVCVNLAKAWGESATERQAAKVVAAVPRLASLTPGQLRQFVNAAKQSGTRTIQGLAHVADSLLPSNSSVLAKWCGSCDAETRLIFAADGDMFCPSCHPRVTA